MDEIERMINSVQDDNWFLFMRFGEQRLMNDREMALRLLLNRVEDIHTRVPTGYGETKAETLHLLICKLGWSLTC